MSFPGANYFLTVCLQRPARGLSNPATAEVLFQEIDHLEKAGCWTWRSAVIMPDHLHLIIRLGATALSDAMRLFKGRTAAALRTAGLRWQPSFFDHRIRSADDLPQFFRYVLLNPYRRGLVSFAELWTGYRCAAEDWKWFGPTTNEGRPWSEWLRSPDPRGEKVQRPK